MEEGKCEREETGKEEETGNMVRELFVRMENIHMTDELQRGYQHITVVYTSEKEYSTMGPLIDVIMTHYALPERIRPYLRIWATPFRTNRIMEGMVVPYDIEFLYIGI